MDLCKKSRDFESGILSLTFSFSCFKAGRNPDEAFTQIMASKFDKLKLEVPDEGMAHLAITVGDILKVKLFMLHFLKLW